MYDEACAAQCVGAVGGAVGLCDSCDGGGSRIGRAEVFYSSLDVMEVPCWREETSVAVG